MMPLLHTGPIFKILFFMKSLTVPALKIVIHWWKSDERVYSDIKELKLALVIFPVEIPALIPHGLRSCNGFIARRFSLVYKTYEPANHMHIEELFEQCLTQNSKENISSILRWLKRSWSRYDYSASSKNIKIKDRHRVNDLQFLVYIIGISQWILKSSRIKMLLAIERRLQAKKVLIESYYWLPFEFDGRVYAVYMGPNWPSHTSILVSSDKLSTLEVIKTNDSLVFRLKNGEDTTDTIY